VVFCQTEGEGAVMAACAANGGDDFRVMSKEPGREGANGVANTAIGTRRYVSDGFTQP